MQSLEAVLKDAIDRGRLLTLLVNASYSPMALLLRGALAAIWTGIEIVELAAPLEF